MKTEIEKLFRTTTMSMQEMADYLGTTHNIVWYSISRMFSKEERDKRKKLIYALSKLGNKNPMYGKKGRAHHGFVGDTGDGYGYILCLKPLWYTGRKKSRHIFKHHLVVCEYLGLTEIPTGWCVHHKDEDKTNNEISNLQLMTISDHMKLHANLRKGN
jgi:hypothetical protein